MLRDPQRSGNRPDLLTGTGRRRRIGDDDEGVAESPQIVKRLGRSCDVSGQEHCGRMSRDRLGGECALVTDLGKRVGSGG